MKFRVISDCGYWNEDEGCWSYDVNDATEFEIDDLGGLWINGDIQQLSFNPRQNEPPNWVNAIDGEELAKAEKVLS